MAVCTPAFVLIFLMSVWPSAHALTDAEDVQSLRIFHSSLNWPNLSGWNDISGDPCLDAWQGITCDTDPGNNIIKIELPGLDLHGTLGWGSFLEKFNHLTVLDLSNNELQGIIPYNLPVGIRLLNLQGNHLTKGLPWSFGQLLFLTEARLAHNKLSGPITDNFSNMKSLVTLDLSDNSFNGSIPSSLRALSDLSFLYLQDNQIESGLDHLLDLSLQALDIRHNSFYGQNIPRQLMEILSFQFSGDEFSTSQGPPAQNNAPSQGEDTFNLSLANSPGTTPDFPQSSELPAPVPSQSPAPYEGSDHNEARATGKSVRAEETALFWSPWRITGLTVASMLALAVAVLTFLFFKWRTVEADRQKEESEVTWF